MSVQDYLIDPTNFEWRSLLIGWTWLLPAEFTVWLVNRYGEVFLVLPPSLDRPGHAAMNVDLPRLLQYTRAARSKRNAIPMRTLRFPIAAFHRTFA